MMATADAVIVGGGVFGASIACFLSEHRAGSVLLLERERVAAGATGSSSAIVRVHYANEWESRLAVISLAVFRNWPERIGGSCGYRQTGFARIVAPDDRERLRHNVAMLQTLGASVSFLEPEQLRGLQPNLSVEGIGGAAYEPDGGFADGSDTAQALLQRAVLHGASLQQGVEVTALVVNGGRVVGVDTSTGRVATRCVVVAAGAWAGDLLQRAGVEVSLRTKLIRAGLIEHSADAPATHATIIDDSIGTYLKPERTNRTEFGLRYEWDVPPAYGPVPVPLAYVADGASHLTARVPALSEAGIVRGWAAPDGFSQDGAPVLGVAPGVEGLYLAAAAGGTGFKISPAVGIGMAELIVHGRGVTVDLMPFRPSRFAEGAAIRSPTDYRRPRWREEPLA